MLRIDSFNNMSILDMQQENNVFTPKLADSKILNSIIIKTFY